MPAEYDRLLTGIDGVTAFTQPSWAHSVYHLYVVRTADRSGLMNHLKMAGIGSGIHYPIPLHLQNAYRSLNYTEGSFPVAEKLAAEIVSLPMFPNLTAEQQARVAAEVLAFSSQVMQGAGL